MAWYRAGGGGIPSSIKTDMNAVLNKKFGTSQDYPPTDWAPSVNLLGPLPEKTASGSVASITDGADGVPLKNWLVTLPASLDGYSAINGTKNTGTGTPETQYTVSLGRTIYGGSVDVVNGTAEPINKLPHGNADTYTINQVSFSVDGEGRFTVSGTATGGPATFYNPLTDTYTIQDGDYLHLMNSAAVANVSVGLRENNTGIVAPACSPVNRIYNLSSYAGRTITQVSVYVPNGGTYEGTITPMIIHGNSATAYSPYFTPFTFTPITPTPETALGTNNFWADEGDSDVTYRADIDLLLGGN